MSAAGEWNEYVKKILAEKSDFDDVPVSLTSDQPSFTVPPIIKVSMHLLDGLLKSGCKLNCFVMPEKDQLIFLFAILKTIHNILDEKILTEYDIRNMEPGTKLKLGKAIVQFVGVEQRGDQQYVSIQCDSSCRTVVKMPIKTAPFFQKTNTERRLSKYELVKAEQKRANAEAEIAAATNLAWILYLKNHKTHFDSSVFYVAPVLRTKRLFSECRIGNDSLSDLLMLGQSDLEGNIVNLGPGQLKGTPALVLCSELGAVSAAAERGYHVQSSIINISNGDKFQDNLSYLDQIINLDKPVLCLCDTVNSFNLEELQNRGFNIWRWNKNTVVPEVIGDKRTVIGQHINNCFCVRVDYQVIEEHLFSDDLKTINSYKENIKECSNNIQSIYEHINAYLFREIRCTSDIPDILRDSILDHIEKDQRDLKYEKNYISDEMYSDFERVLNDLHRSYLEFFDYGKAQYIKQYIRVTQPASLTVVVTDHTDIDYEERFWDEWCDRKRYQTYVNVLSVSDFLSQKEEITDYVFVCGWLNKKVIGKIVYGFIASRFCILLYSCESEWQKYGTYSIRKGLNDDSNNDVISQIREDENVTVRTSTIAPWKKDEEHFAEEQSIEQIDRVLQESRINRYTGSQNTGEPVDAVPVTFNGDYMAFYRNGHTVITATEIIENAGEDIKTKKPEELELGDFVVVSEVEHNLIEDKADSILKKENNLECIKIAGKWRESIEMEKVFSTNEEIMRKLMHAGEGHSKQTVNNWINDLDMIAPKRKQDIEDIANALQDNVLLEMADEIYESAEKVRIARQRAGRILAEDLRKEVPSALEKMDEIDPYNIWDPIHLDIEDFGEIIILKIIDISHKIKIDPSRTDHLIRDDD